MAVHASHAALPYPIKGARFSLLVPLLDADGDPTAPTTPDTEISEDNGAATDAAEEVTATSGMDGMGLITFTGAETDCSTLGINFKSASGPKATLATLYPRVLASVGAGTLAAGSAGGGTLGTLLTYDVTGCFIKTTGGTGGGGAGGAGNQARRIVTYNTGTGAFTVAPDWETAPSTDTTYDVLLPDGVTLGMLKALNPATAGRTADIDSSGRVLLQPTQGGVTIPTVTTLTNAPPDSAGVTTLLDRITAARAGYWDHLNVGGAVASQADINALNQSASRRVILATVGQYERPDSGNATYTVEARTYDGDGAPANADSTPTLTATGAGSGDLSANLGASSNPATGVYRWTYTVASAAALEQIRFDFSATISGGTFPMAVYTQTTDAVAADFTSADRTKLEAIHNAATEARLAELDPAKLPANVDAVKAQTQAIEADTQDLQTQLGTAGAGLTAIGDTRLGTAATQATAAATSAASADGKATTLLTNLAALAAKLTGITSLRNWLQALSRKGNPDPTAVTEINADNGTGTGAYNPATDSPEAIRDRGDVAWLTGAGAGGSHAVTITVRDSSSHALLVGARVNIFAGDGTSLVDYADTNSSGQAVFSLNPGSYFYAVPALPGYASQANTALTVDGAETATVDLVAIPATVVSAGSRVLRVIVVDGSGELKSGVTVTASLIQPKSSIANAFPLTTQLSDTTGADGIADLALITSDQFEEGSGEYLIEIPGAASRRVAVPAGSGAYNLQVAVTS